MKSHPPRSEPKAPLTNGDFTSGRPGALPKGWKLKAACSAMMPVFRLVRQRKGTALLAAGNGSADCFGYLRTEVSLRPGQAYRLRVHFRPSRALNPHFHLRFAVFVFFGTRAFNDGVFRYLRLPGGWVEGEGTFVVPQKRPTVSELRMAIGLTARGRALVRSISLEPCAPPPAQWVTVACVQGRGGLRAWSRVLDRAGRARADLTLLTETMNGASLETFRGPSARLMARKARQHRMYVAGGILLRRRPQAAPRNAALLFDRQGRLAGHYEKNHPYSPELWSPPGVVPGDKVPVFGTDFGNIGIMICYDSWFTDVAELLALKGAQIILFPNAGYCQGIMPARAADNGVRLAISSLTGPAAIYDTAGRSVTRPRADPSNHANCSPRTTARQVRWLKVGKARLLIAQLNFSASPSPHNWGGPMLSAPGGRRNRREQRRLLYGEIQRYAQRWWEST